MTAVQQIRKKSTTIRQSATSLHQVYNNTTNRRIASGSYGKCPKMTKKLFPWQRPLRDRNPIEYESVPIQLPQCRFSGLAISNDKILIYFSKKNTEAILSNTTRKLLRFEMTKILTAV